MCESKVVILADGKREVIMQAAAAIKVDRDSICCIDIAGNEVRADNVRVKEMNLMKHEIIFERSR